MNIPGANTIRSLFRRTVRRPHVFVACFPKSGSTYLCKAIEALTGFPSGFVAEHGKHNDQDISPRKLRRLRSPSVIQQHTQGTCNNVRLMKEFGIQPVVHVRNLYDVVISLFDHLKNEDYRVPTGYVHREYWQLGYREQLDHLIHVHLPWYFNFMVSWHETADELPTLLTSYENLVSNGPQLLSQIADFHGLRADNASIEHALRQSAGPSTRLNRGIIGRGRTELSPMQLATIARLAHNWGVPTSVWEQIGIRAAA